MSNELVAKKALTLTQSQIELLRKQCAKLAPSRDKNMITDQGIERLRTLYSVLAGTPARSMNLDTFYRQRGDAPQVQTPQERYECGCVACAGGWAAVYPEFAELGLRVKDDLNSGWLIYYGSSDSWEALAAFFFMNYHDARSVFDGYGFSRYTTDLDEITHGRPSHKRMALHRIREYLFSRGAISAERNRELRAFEAQF